MKSITVETTLNAPAHAVWSAVQRPEAFVHVAGAILRFPAAERHAGPWSVGDEIRGWLFLFRVVPLTRHTLRVVDIDHDAMTLFTEEGGGFVRTWNHHIEVRALSDTRCVYTDRIDIDAGILTSAVALFARFFYRHRQRRWARLAPLLTAATASDESSTRQGLPA